MDLDLKFKFRVVAQISKISEFRHLILCTGRSSLILLFHCMNGADQTGPINTENPWSGMRAPPTRSTYARCEDANSLQKFRVLDRSVCTSRTYFELEVRMPLQSGPTVSL
jgi:hypothetical protein